MDLSSARAIARARSRHRTGRFAEETKAENDEVRLVPSQKTQDWVGAAIDAVVEKNRRPAPRPKLNSIAASRPDLAGRLVDSDVAERVAAGSGRHVGVWCDGVVQGKPEHGRVEYTQRVFDLNAGRNGCPECGRGRGTTSRHGELERRKYFEAEAQVVLRPKENSIAMSRPELVDRLVDQDIAEWVTTGSGREVGVWCDGAVQGEDPHPRRTYNQAAIELIRGNNACPFCKYGGEKNWLANRAPDVVHRLVDPADAVVSAGTEAHVRVWCDGTAQGKDPHPRREYQQRAGSLAKGHNACPLCGHLRDNRTNQLANRASEVVDRLVDPADAAVSAGTQAHVRVWCDGTVQGREPHPRREYQQRAEALARGRNACPYCGRHGEANNFANRAPEVVDRLVDPADAALSAVANNHVRAWCDGVVVGKEPHDRVEYQQSAVKLAKGYSGCPICKKRKSAGLLAHRSDLAGRLVDSGEDGQVAAGSNSRVRVWCDGVVAGKEPHDRVEYQQIAASLAKGLSGCPVCGRGGERNHLAKRAPEVVYRLVDPSDAAVSAGTQTHVRVWCDGTAQGKDPHPRREYQQRAASLGSGKNGCPACGGRGRPRTSPRQ